MITDLDKRAKWIWVSTDFIGFHKWVDAPTEVSFLRERHRHKFFVKLEIEVFHADRELEFFIVQRQLINFINLKVDAQDVGSCETIALIILEHFSKLFAGRKLSVSVSEDSENGATIKNY